MMINVLIYGAGGKMGRAVLQCLKNSGTCAALAGVDKYADPADFDIPVYKNIDDAAERADVIIDFSVKEAVYDVLAYAEKHNIPCVLATTGYGAAEQATINAASAKIALFQSANLSTGVYVLAELAKHAARLIGADADIEIVEQHHNQKADSPSGTALLLANAVKSVKPDLECVYGREGIVGKRKKNELGIHAVRGGTIVGKHEVMFIMDNEIITVRHEAESKAMLANGAIRAAEFLTGKAAGLYNMKDLMARR